MVAYILIASDRINKTMVALCGGAYILLALGVVAADDVFYSHETGIDWNVIFLLFGMMIIVGVLRQTGVFEYIAIWAAKRANGSPLRIMILLVLVTAIASSLLDNVTTVLLIAPVTLLVCERLDDQPGTVLDCRSSRLEHRRRVHPRRRSAQHHHHQPGGSVVQRLPDPHGAHRGDRHRRVHCDAAVHLRRGSFGVDPARVSDVMSLKEREAIQEPRLCSSSADLF